MKSERLVSILLLLQGRSPRSARDLAQQLEVSMRTIYRDVDALCAAGVPVYAERGNGGGIALSDGYRKTIAQFNTDELHALFVSAADPLADLGVTGHGLALHKIEGTLSDLQRRAAEKARQRIFLDHHKWYRPVQPSAVLATLRRAVWDDRVLTISYRDRTGTTTTRTIEPLGLVAKAGVWYSVSRTNGELRSFRADRILSAQETGASFERPVHFDLESYWRTSMSTFERTPEQAITAELVIESDALESLTAYFPLELVEDSGTCKRVRVQFPSQIAAEGHILMFCGRIKSIDPAHLREAVAERARAFLSVLELDAYGSALRALTREHEVIGNETVGDPKHDVEPRAGGALQNDTVGLDAARVGGDTVSVGQ